MQPRHEGRTEKWTVSEQLGSKLIKLIDDLWQTGVDARHLGNEDGGHSLVEGRAVHVDGGPDGQDKSIQRNLVIDAETGRVKI